MCAEREFFIDNLLVRIHFVIVLIRWTGLAPWECVRPNLRDAPAGQGLGISCCDAGEEAAFCEDRVRDGPASGGKGLQG